MTALEARWLLARKADTQATSAGVRWCKSIAIARSALASGLPPGKQSDESVSLGIDWSWPEQEQTMLTERQAIGDFQKMPLASCRLCGPLL